MKTIHLKQNPPGMTNYYEVRDLNTGARWLEYSAGAQKYAELPGYDVLLSYSYRDVMVDGIHYERRQSIPNVQFYTFKEDVTHIPDIHVFLDSPFVYQQRCAYCERDWQMNESAFLHSGEIRCAYCDAFGGSF